MQFPRNRFVVPTVATVLFGTPAVVVSWMTLRSAPTTEDVIGVIALGVSTVAVISTASLVQEGYLRNTESQRISKRSRTADELLEQALAEFQRVDTESQRQDEALVLARLWASVNSRLEKYHDDAQTQGRHAFRAAMAAMSMGFLLLLGGGAAAVAAPTTTGAVVAGSLGGIAAAVAGYIAKTFLRVHEETSRHLRAYFLQPVEMSRYLSAERMITQSGLAVEVQADLVRVLIHSMVTGALAEGSGPAGTAPPQA